MPGVAATLSRRTALGVGVAATAAVVAGCADEAPPPASSYPQAAADSADLDLVKAAIEDEQALLDLVTQLRSSERSLRRRLRPVVGAAEQHLAALRAVAPELETETAESPDNAGLDPKSAALAVGRAASRLHRKRSADCIAAEAGALAMLFAAIAAGHAVTAEQWRSR